jgi:hypothetical protein
MTGARDRLGVLLALALSAGLLSWVAGGFAAAEAKPGYAGHYYEFLVEGFLHGHTYLDLQPDPGLARLRDPYDPAENAGLRLSDATYYKGRYYLYYGPTPAVTLMLPWRVVTGRPMPERVAAVVFATLALAALGLLVLEVKARHFPAAPGWVPGTVVLAALHASSLPVLVRRPMFWELPHASALCFLWWALYLLWRCRTEPGRALWAALLGACLVLLIGSRPTFLFPAAAISALALLPRPGRAGGVPRSWMPAPVPALALAVPLALGGSALLAYNLVRFGRPSEFGQSYMLSNAYEHPMVHLSLSFLPVNAWLYLWALPSFGPYFPFTGPVAPARLPPGYLGTEEMHSCLFALPVEAAALAALAWIWRRRSDPAVGGAAAVVAAGIVTSLLTAGILLDWLLASARYVTELVGGWTVAASVGLLAVFGRDPAFRVPRTARWAALAAMAWTAAFVWLASLDFGGLFRATCPVAYAAAARAADLPSLWAARIGGVRYGPVEVGVSLAPLAGAGESDLLATGYDGRLSRLVLVRADRDHARLELRENDAVIAAVDLPAGPGPFVARVEAPWLYPPPEHPYWDAFTDPVERRDRQTRFAVGAGGRVGVGYSGSCFDASGLEPRVAARAAGAVGWVDSVRFLTSRRP